MSNRFLCQHAARTVRHRYLTTMAAMLALASVLSGQNRRIGTAGATELLIPVGGRSFANAGSDIARVSGIDGIYWNPAAISKGIRRADAMFSTMTYIDDINVHYGALAVNLGDIGTIGVSIKSLSIGDILVTTNDDPDGLGGRLFSPSIITGGISFGRIITDNIAVGGTLNIVSQDLGRVSATAVAFDLGIQYANAGGFDGLHLGVAIRHLGSEITLDGPGLLRDAEPTVGLRPVQKLKSEPASFDLPTIAELGLTYHVRANNTLSINLNGAFCSDNLYQDSYRTGVDLFFEFDGFTLTGAVGGEMLASEQNAELEDIFGICYGVGLTTRTEDVDLHLFFGYRATTYFAPNHVVTVMVGF